jgi:hypothetical protein
MAVPILTPASTLSAIVLPSVGTLGDVAATLPFGIYSTSPAFISGAADQVGYVYKKLGGDILDIELTTGNVYAAYEEAVLEYSYLVNLHQATNALPSYLGKTTGSFDQDGELVSGSALYNSLSGSRVELAYPKYSLDIVRNFGKAYALEGGLSSNDPIYSASLQTIVDVQDYDLQAIIESASVNNIDVSNGGPVPYAGKVGNKKVVIRKVFYKTPASMWRFFGYYGGLNTIGNLSSYGQYADDSTFEVIPTWQNKLQAMAYETSIYTRNSHYSFEIKNNKLRLFPVPTIATPFDFWVEFSIPSDPWTENDPTKDTGIHGINNMNTLPFANIPYESINSIGKQWIRRYALAVCKEMLGQVRSKFNQLPIPGDAITLNGTALLGEAATEKKDLRDELKTILAEMTYPKVIEQQAALSDNLQKVDQKIPMLVFVG